MAKSILTYQETEKEEVKVVEPKKVLLVSPPNYFLENPHSVPKIGLLYLGTALTNAGHHVKIVQLDDLTELENLIEEQFDFVGISATTREYPDAISILNYLKRENYPAPVMIGGAHANALPNECLRNGFDLVVTGEAEREIVEIVENYTPSSPEVIHAGYIRDINSIAIPDRTILSNPTIWQPFMTLEEKSSLRTSSILLSRGCPFHCSFCGQHFPYRRRSEVNITEELRVIEELGFEAVVIIDDLPFLNEKHVEVFCGQIKPSGLKFRCNFRADLLNTKIAMMLKEAGCQRLQIGVESASQKVLVNINKNLGKDDGGRAIEICQSMGLEVKAMFIWGLPGDGHEEAERIISWVQTYRPSSIQLSRFIPLPGSPIWKNGEHKRVIDYNCLSFFPKNGDIYQIGVGNDCLTKQELNMEYQRIISSCQKYVHVDLGVPLPKEVGE